MEKAKNYQNPAEIILSEQSDLTSSNTPDQDRDEAMERYKLKAWVIVVGGLLALPVAQRLFFTLNPLKDFASLFSEEENLNVSNKTLLYYSGFMLTCALGVYFLAYHQAQKATAEVEEVLKAIDEKFKNIHDEKKRVESVDDDAQNNVSPVMHP